MSFDNKATVIYKVHPEPGSDGRAGHLSVRTDRHYKGSTSSWWSVSNRALVMALVEGSYLNSWMVADDLDIEGDDDGVIFVTFHKRGREEPLYQLEYERHHDIAEKPKGLFSEPSAKTGAQDMSRRNPLSFSSLSTGEKVGVAAAGAAVLGLAGYLIWKSQQSASTAASLPVVTTPMPGTTPIAPTPGPVDQPTVSTGGQVYDPNLGGSGAIMPMGG